MAKVLRFSTFFVLSLLLSFSAINTELLCQQLNPGQTFVRTHDNTIRQQVSTYSDINNSVYDISLSDSICAFLSYAKHGQIAPGTGGGTLVPSAFMNPTTINTNSKIAFYSQVNGSVRNQGIFTADSNGIYNIAIGSGAGGGSGDTSANSGDPSPIGGTFSGFFGGTVYTPAINDAGDVLFLCDVNGGSSPRGLFLYQSATQQIVKIAAVGDPSPIGGTFDAIGPGSINNNGKVVFLAAPVGTIQSNIFMWDNGTISKVAAMGDPAPGGGTYSMLGTESFGFPDGTNIPAGPVPDINDQDQIAFRAIVSGGITDRGIIVRTGGADTWYIKALDPTPAGGTYLDFQAPSINNNGQVAFFSDYRPTPSTINSGLFAGSPDSWRKVIVFYDPIDGGQCYGLAFLRNPMQSIDQYGNVIFWTDIVSGGGSDRLALGLTNGDFIIVARKGQPSPIGGTISSMDAWPSTYNLWGSLNAATPGAAGGALSAHMVYEICSSWVPVEFTAFTAASSIGSVDLNWATATEINNKGFEIQRSIRRTPFGEIGDQRSDISIWEKVGFVEGAGTTTEPRSYSFTDNNVSTGNYTYRLKQIDFDGTYKFSNEVEVLV
ncbi:MAG TPA: choice-of-anchor tandem repeat NxxGxxAF-containing protein, partial [Ignavibacteriaceae bacterium]|nr:choice-of-anchor tandem repeat NxxGxxAF-containing protein [Ignavibacteriaceae bacterium]